MHPLLAKLKSILSLGPTMSHAMQIEASAAAHELLTDHENRIKRLEGEMFPMIGAAKEMVLEAEAAAKAGVTPKE